MEGERLGPHRMEWWVARVGVVRPVLGAGPTVGECASPRPAFQTSRLDRRESAPRAGCSAASPRGSNPPLAGSRPSSTATLSSTPRRRHGSLLAPGPFAPDHRPPGRSEGYTRLPRGAGELRGGQGTGAGNGTRTSAGRPAPGEHGESSGTVRRHFWLV